MTLERPAIASVEEYAAAKARKLRLLADADETNAFQADLEALTREIEAFENTISIHVRDAVIDDDPHATHVGIG